MVLDVVNALPKIGTLICKKLYIDKRIVLLGNGSQDFVIRVIAGSESFAAAKLFRNVVIS